VALQDRISNEKIRDLLQTANMVEEVEATPIKLEATCKYDAR
jgi:hypothetical protein